LREVTETGGIVAVLLAAGSASRFGSAKQLVPIEDVSLVRRAAQGIVAAGLELVVISGAYAGEVAAALSGLPLRLIHNPQWQQGMGGSIACGARELLGRTEAPACLLCLADQPLIGAPQLQRLLGAAAEDRTRIIASKHSETPGGEVLGPPCLFPAEFLAGLAQLSGAKGARVLLDRYRPRVTAVAMPEAALDIDVPEDYQRALEQLAQAAAMQPLTPRRKPR
jgi:molybdenum cofactor cytidylyltransferase